MPDGPDDRAGLAWSRSSVCTSASATLEVLKGIDLAVRPARRSSIIGPSGSGKTTLLRCVDSSRAADAGQVRSTASRSARSWSTGAGVEMSDRELARMRAGIGMVFQRFNLFPHLTALDNVALGPIQVLRQSAAPRRAPLAMALLRQGRAGAQGATTIPRGCPAGSSSASRSPARWRCSRG